MPHARPALPGKAGLPLLPALVSLLLLSLDPLAKAPLPDKSDTTTTELVNNDSMSLVFYACLGLLLSRNGALVPSRQQARLP